MSRKVFLLLFVLPAIVYSSNPCDNQNCNPNTSDAHYRDSINYVLQRERTGNVGYRSCPHSAFVSKHILTRNLNTASHAAYSADERTDIRNRIRTSPTGIQSLFYAPGMTYTQVGDYCIFNRAATKWNCQLDRSEFAGWACRNHGLIIAKHSVNNGHYDPNNDEIVHDEFGKK